MSLLDDVLTDLAAEGDELDAAVAGLDDAGWRSATPAQGWDIATQVAHLAWTDEAACLAVAAASGDNKGWDDLVLAAIADVDGFVDQSALEGAKAPAGDLLERWRAGRIALRAALRGVPDGVKLPWFGPPMSPTSMATARFMETWAHGLDVYDALGLDREPTDRVRHVVHLGVRTRNFSFGAHSMEPPTDEFRVELKAPSGEQWVFGPEDAALSVTGSAYDFALLVTQRRHRDDLDLTASGADADRWLDVAQAFAGPPGEKRQPS